MGELLDMQTNFIFFNFRHVQKAKEKHRIKARRDVSVNTNAQNVNVNGCLVIRGQIWDRSASNVILMFIQINRLERFVLIERNYSS